MVDRELREQFIALLGHDLRNPLASIAAGTKILAKTTIDVTSSPEETRFTFRMPLR